MAHTDLLIFFNTAFWIFFLFIFLYFLILVLFNPNTFARVRIFSLHRVFLMSSLFFFFQIGLELSKMLHYYIIFFRNLLVFSTSFEISHIRLLYKRTAFKIKFLFKKTQLITTYLHFNLLCDLS